MKKNGIFDYLSWRGDLDFARDPFCEVDNLVFSQISYIDYTDIADGWDIYEAQNLFDAIAEYEMLSPERKYLGAIIPRDTEPLAREASRLARYRDVKVFGYVNIIDESAESQFCAVTFLLPSGEAVVTYRGTDDTLVGWKENLNMSFLPVTSAQKHALRYLSRVADVTGERGIYVCGHSKGGNLAVWAAVKCRSDVNDRVVAAYNYDGPGFDRAFIESDEYKKTRDRIRTLVPRSSVVGMLLEHEENYDVVMSTYTGLLQHNAFSWEIMGGRFIYTDSVTAESRRIDNTLKRWLAEISVEKRKQIINSLYEILSSTNAKTLTELNADKLALIKAWNALDAESKKIVRRCIALIVKNTKK